MKIVNSLESNIAMIAPPGIKVDSIKTFDGIRSFYKWTFDEQFVYGYISPESPTFAKKYPRPSFAFF